MLVIGIDPGRNGGIAAVSVNADGTRCEVAHKIPMCPRELCEIATAFRLADLAVIERVHSSPQMGVRSAFTFGEVYGRLVQSFVSAGIPLEYVTPQRWQRALGCLSGGDKNVTKSRAQALFPRLAVSHWSADALLLAEYGVRLLGNSLGGRDD